MGGVSMWIMVVVMMAAPMTFQTMAVPFPSQVTCERAAVGVALDRRTPFLRAAVCVPMPALTGAEGPA